jgi:hypothetical protein
MTQLRARVASTVFLLLGLGVSLGLFIPGLVLYLDITRGLHEGTCYANFSAKESLFIHEFGGWNGTEVVPCDEPDYCVSLYPNCSQVDIPGALWPCACWFNHDGIL